MWHHEALEQRRVSGGSRTVPFLDGQMGCAGNSRWTVLPWVDKQVSGLQEVVALRRCSSVPVLSCMLLLMVSSSLSASP